MACNVRRSKIINRKRYDSQRFLHGRYSSACFRNLTRSSYCLLRKSRGFVALASSPLLASWLPGCCCFKHSLKGQCPDYAHARASSVFSSKDNRTVKLTRQDFLPDRTADGDLLFIFSGNILDFRRNLSSYLKCGSGQEDSSRFYR